MVDAEVEKFYNAADEIASFLKPRLKDRVRVKINTHTDPDGISAGNILARCLNYYDVPFHISFGGPPDEEDVEELSEQDYDLFVFIDQGTGQFSMIEEHLLEGAGKEVLVLDHHPGKVEERPGFALLNPHTFGLNGAKDVSAAGVVFSVVERLDDRFKSLSEMALVGALGDRQKHKLGFSGINQEILDLAVEENVISVREGLKLDGRTSPLTDVLSHSVRPYLLGLSGREDKCEELIEDLDFDPDTVIEEIDFEDEKKLREEILDRIEMDPDEDFKDNLWGEIYTPKVRQAVGPENLHCYVTMLDACEKLGRLEAGFSALLGNESSRNEAIGTLREYQESMIETIDWFISNEEKIKTTDQIRHVYVGDEIETKMLGEALSIALESGVIDGDLPLIGIGDLGENRIKVSARASSKYVGPDIGEILGKVSRELGGSGGGHDVAAAARLLRERKDEFVKKVDHQMNESRKGD